MGRAKTSYCPLGERKLEAVASQATWANQAWLPRHHSLWQRFELFELRPSPACNPAHFLDCVNRVPWSYPLLGRLGHVCCLMYIQCELGRSSGAGLSPLPALGIAYVLEEGGVVRSS